MPPELEKALSNTDPNEIMVRAACYAARVLHKYAWRGRKSSRRANEDFTPDAQSPEDFVNEAFRRLLGGQRTYNPERSLQENVNSVVESLVSSAKKASDRTPLCEIQDFDKEAPTDPVAASPSAQGELKHEAADQEFLEDQRQAFKKMRNALQDDPKAQYYLEALSEGYDKPAEIADLTGIPIAQIYEIRRKIKKQIKSLFGVQNFGELKRILMEG